MVTRLLPLTFILVIIERISRNMFKPHYLKNRKDIPKFLLHFCHLQKILCILKKKVSFIAQIFRRLLSSRNVVTYIPESSYFTTPFGNQRVHVSQTLLKYARQNLYPKFLLIQDKLSWKTSLSVRCEILALFGNTLTSAHMYFRDN